MTDDTPSNSGLRLERSISATARTFTPSDFTLHLPHKVTSIFPELCTCILLDVQVRTLFESQSKGMTLFEDFCVLRRLCFPVFMCPRTQGCEQVRMRVHIPPLYLFLRDLVLGAALLLPFFSVAYRDCKNMRSSELYLIFLKFSLHRFRCEPNK